MQVFYRQTMKLEKNQLKKSFLQFQKEELDVATIAVVFVSLKQNRLGIIQTLIKQAVLFMYLLMTIWLVRKDGTRDAESVLVTKEEGKTTLKQLDSLFRDKHQILV